MAKQPLLLMILDGWGIAPAGQYNAAALAKTPNLDALFDKYPHTRLSCSGAAVGLPDGQMGNSEVGHLNIGAGRIVYQELTRITKAIKDGDFFENTVLSKAMQTVKANGSALHLLGLVSDGGVHSHISHLFALLEMAKRQGLNKVYVHAFLDGRDVGPQTADVYLAELDAEMKRTLWTAINAGNVCRKLMTLWFCMTALFVLMRSAVCVLLMRAGSLMNL